MNWYVFCTFDFFNVNSFEIFRVFWLLFFRFVSEDRNWLVKSSSWKKILLRFNVMKKHVCGFFMIEIICSWIDCW